MQRTPGETVAERTKYWTKIIHAARLYPAGVTAYCRDNKIQKNNYYSWFKKLRKDHPEWTDLDKQNSTPKTKNAKSLPKAEVEVQAKAKRRRFTADYRAKILQEIDSALPGQITAILRREGLYPSHLSKWRGERESRMAEAKRGPKANPEASELKKLRAQNERLTKRLDQANKIIELQKKVAELFGGVLPEFNEEI